MGMRQALLFTKSERVLGGATDVSREHEAEAGASNVERET